MTDPDITREGIAKALLIAETIDGNINPSFVAYARNALPLIAARMEALEADAASWENRAIHQNSVANQAIADKEAAEKRADDLLTQIAELDDYIAELEEREER